MSLAQLDYVKKKKKSFYEEDMLHQRTQVLPATACGAEAHAKIKKS